MCGQSGHIYDVYGVPLGGPQSLCNGAESSYLYYQTNECRTVSGGIELVSNFYDTVDCTGSVESQSSYFLQNCDGTSTVSYTCVDATSNPSQPWAIASTPHGYLLSSYDYSDTDCSGIPTGYSVLVNGICQYQYEYNCPEGESYSTNDCSGTPYTYELTMGCIRNQGSETTTNYACV